MKNKVKFLTLFSIVVIALSILFTTTSIASSDLFVNNVEVNVNETKAEITWSASKNADGYDVYLEMPNLGYLFIGSVKNTKVNVKGLTEGEIYAVKIQAYRVNGSQKEYSDFSPEVEFKFGENEQAGSTLKTITNLKAETNGSEGSISWDAVENADGYEVYASVGTSNFQNIGAIYQNSAKITGIVENEVYSLKVKPFMEMTDGNKTYGSFSNVVILKYAKNNNDEKPGKVRNVNVSMDENIATLTWNEVEDADGYEILVESSKGNEWTYEADNNILKLNIKTPNYTYKAKVVAYKYVNGEKKYGDYSNTVSIRYDVETDRVTGLKVSMDGEEATFTWNEVEDADGYVMQINIPGEGNKDYYLSKAEKILDGFKPSYGRCSVRVRAYKNINGTLVYGDWTSKKYFENEEEEIPEPDKVTGLTVDITGTKAVLEWNSVKNADGYELLIDLPNGDEREISTTGTKFTIHNLDEMTGEYSVKVRAYIKDNGEKNYGEYSNVKKFKYQEEDDDVDVPRVTGLKVTMNGDEATFTWNEVEDVDGYKMEIEIPGIGTTSYFVNDNKKVLNGFTQTDYDYSVRVRAYSGSEYGDWSAKKYFRNEEEPDDDDDEKIEKPAKVTGLTVVRVGEKATFTWNEVKGATGYKMEINIPGIGTTSYFVDDNTKVLTGFTQTKYKYTVRVRAYVNSNIQDSYGAWSSTKEF